MKDDSRDSGRQRLFRALRPGASRASVVVALLLALLGFAAVVQVRVNHADTDFSGARRQDLVELLDSLDAAAQRAQSEISDLQQTQRSLETNADANRVALEAARRQVETLGILAGTLPAVGEGVRITIDDPSGSVGSSTLVNAIEELRDAGAEAIEINDRVRLVAESAVVDTDSGVTVDGVGLRAPYVIDAIGSSHTLSDAVVFPGGLGDEVEALGGTVKVQELPNVEVSALHTPKEPQYAQPTSGSGG
jgi:uncharacterized protein YlxW (UPF0749 family)